MKMRRIYALKELTNLGRLSYSQITIQKPALSHSLCEGEKEKERGGGERGERERERDLLSRLGHLVRLPLDKVTPSGQGHLLRTVSLLQGKAISSKQGPLLGQGHVCP